MGLWPAQKRAGRLFKNNLNMEVKDIKGEADKNEIAQITAHRTGENPDAVRNLADTLFEVIAEAVAVHHRVELHDIGTFSLILRAPRSGVNPFGQHWETAERYEVKFDASPKFAELVQAHMTLDPEAPVI